MRTVSIVRRVTSAPALNAISMRRLARTLNGMLDRVGDSVRRERAFVSAASHDLRTPIAALRTELELAERAPDDRDAMHAAVRLAHADAVRLSNLAADLLGLAEAESTGRTVARQPVAVGQLVEGAITRVLPLAAERSIVIRFEASEGIVDVDRVRLEQALVNLLANAIRESPIGSSVEVEADIELSDPDPSEMGRDGSPGTLDISVADRGSGVADDVRPVLFVPFASRARGRSDGTGLGVATAAAAVRAHHGAIGYADRAGGGSVFRFRVPTNVFNIRPAAVPPGAVPRLAGSSGRRGR
jgi:two-component system, OmpR family, sensor kinase